MKNIGTVSSEGGSLLIADALTAQAWRGATFDDQDDYERACELFEAQPSEGKLISISTGEGLIWDMGGAGVSDVFLKTPSHLVVIRSWMEDPADTASIVNFASASLHHYQQLDSLQFETGMVALLWAPESGAGIKPTGVLGDAHPINGLSVDGSGLLVKLEPGSYQCLHDEISNAFGEARRLHLIKAVNKNS